MTFARIFAQDRPCVMGSAIGGLAVRKRTDAELLSSFLATHDEDAYAALADRYRQMVYGVCRRVLGHHFDAQVACADVLIKLWRDAYSIRKAESLGSWLHGVAFRVASDLRKKIRRRQMHEDCCGEEGLNQPSQPSPVLEEVEFHELEGCVDAELARMPEKYRIVFILCGLQGESMMEVARQLGIPLGTVSSRLSTARDRLRRRLRAFKGF